MIMRVSKKYLEPSIYSYPYWRLKSNIRFYKGVFCLFGHPHHKLSQENIQEHSDGSFKFSTDLFAESYACRCDYS